MKNRLLSSLADAELPIGKRAGQLSLVLRVLAVMLCIALCVYVLMRAKHAGWDSWSPMSAALEFVRKSTDPLYSILFFSEGIKFQYPPTGLLYLELLNLFGVNSVPQYNLVNAIALLIFALVFSIFVARVVKRVTLFGL